MYKYQFTFFKTGEIVECDYVYKYPHTAVRAALTHLEKAVKYRDREPSEKVHLKIIGESPIFQKASPVIDYGKDTIESLISHLTKHP